MNDNYSIEPVDKIENEMWGLIGGGISDYNRREAGDDHAQTLGFMLHAPDGELVGGVIAELYWDWLYINLMYIKEDLRGQGYGQRLLAMAEEEASRRGARHVHLDTFSFQAPGFYKKQGYEVFGTLPEFPAGHQRYYMTKEL